MNCCDGGRLYWGNVGPFLKFSSFFYCRSLYKWLEEPLVWLNKAAHSYCSVKDAPLLSWIIPDHRAAILSSSFLLYFLDNIFGRCTFSVINCICWGIFFSHNRCKQMYVQQIIPRNKSIRSRRSNYYVDTSKFSRLATNWYGQIVRKISTAFRMGKDKPSYIF